jgi:hypothetical protein
MPEKIGKNHIVERIGPEGMGTIFIAYRAAGWDVKKGGMASAYGSWWADEAVLAHIGSTLQGKWGASVLQEYPRREFPESSLGLSRSPLVRDVQ